MQSTSITALGGARPGPKPDRTAQLVEGAARFERIFSQMFITNMRESAKIGDGPGMFGDGPGSDTYADWFDGLLAEHLGGAGGLGIKRVLIDEWTRPAAGAASAGAAAGKTGVNHVVA